MKYILCLTFLFSTLSLSQAEQPPVVITEVFKKDHPEQKDKEVLVMRIDLGPGIAAPAHMHPGMVTGYVVSGTLEFQIEGGPLLTLKGGDPFFEPPGSKHLVARNPSATERVLIIAFIINPKGQEYSQPLMKH